MRAVALITLSAVSMSCSRSRKFDELARGDRSLEKKGCPSTFAYEPPIFTDRLGFLPLPSALRQRPREPAFEYDLGWDSGTLVDVGGAVYRYCGKNNHGLVGHIDPAVFTRMLSFREAAVTAPFQWFPPPGCSNYDGGGVISVYGPAKTREQPTEIARSAPKTMRRVSPEADLLIRWVIAVHDEVRRIPLGGMECTEGGTK